MILGLDKRHRDALGSMMLFLVRKLDKKSDPEVARARLRAVIMGFVHDPKCPGVVISASGAWRLADLDEDQMVLFALEVEPRVKRIVPASTWRGLGKVGRTG